MMNAREKPDSVIVARKSSNKTGNRKVMLDAETMERRAEAKENAKQQSMRRAQNRESVKQALDRVRTPAPGRRRPPSRCAGCRPRRRRRPSRPLAP